MAAITQAGRPTWNTPRLPRAGGLIERAGRFAAWLNGTSADGSAGAARAARIETKVEHDTTKTFIAYSAVNRGP